MKKVQTNDHWDALIDFLGNLNKNKLENVKVNMLDWISELELTRQRLYAIGHQITDAHFIMHILAES